MAAAWFEIMLAMPEVWNHTDRDTGAPCQLPQPWAQVCTYAIYAIAERVKGAA